MNREHPLEKKFNAPYWDILDAIMAGFRAQVDVRGKLAELYLQRELVGLKKSGIIEDFDWRDKDGKPDFGVTVSGRLLQVEVKNVRGGSVIWDDPPGFMLELQKTRNSLLGRSTRSYPVTSFDVVAACLFNQTGHWRYLYIATRNLGRTEVDERLLQIYHRVPPQAEDPWRQTLKDAINDAIA